MNMYVYITHNVCIIIILRDCRGRPVGLAVSIYMQGVQNLISRVRLSLLFLKT